jgi:cation diffusion facilitator CzcD-associated flavoprotein CzcO
MPAVRVTFGLPPGAALTDAVILAAMPTLAVVGAGPKGIAIAAKARVLAAAGLDAPRVVLVGRDPERAAWRLARPRRARMTRRNCLAWPDAHIQSAARGR